MEIITMGLLRNKIVSQMLSCSFHKISGSKKGENMTAGKVISKDIVGTKENYVLVKKQGSKDECIGKKDFPSSKAIIVILDIIDVK